MSPRTGPARPVAPPSTYPAPAVVQRPAVSWGGGVQHNGNNPEVVDTLGRSHSSRAFAPGGAPFDGAAPQQVFSSNKNLTGRPASTSLVLSNPGRAPLRLGLDLSIDEPASTRGTRVKQLVVPPGGSVAVPIAAAAPSPPSGRVSHPLTRPRGEGGCTSTSSPTSSGPPPPSSRRCPS